MFLTTLTMIAVLQLPDKRVISTSIEYPTAALCIRGKADFIKLIGKGEKAQLLKGRIKFLTIQCSKHKYITVPKLQHKGMRL